MRIYYVCINVYKCIYVCVNIFMCIYICYIYIYIIIIADLLLNDCVYTYDYKVELNYRKRNHHSSY